MPRVLLKGHHHPLHTPPSSFITPPSPFITHPSSFITPPSPLLTPPSSFITHPSPLLTPPSSFLTPPSPFITPPSPLITPPSSFITPPSPLITHHSSFITNKPHRRHRPLCHREAHVVDSQTALLEGEAGAVDAHEMVVLGAVRLHGLAVEADAQCRREMRGQLRHLSEKAACRALPRGARIVHRMRPCPQAPPSAPLVADDCAHRAAVGIVDSVTLFCHNCLFFV